MTGDAETAASEWGIGWEVLAISAPGFGGDAISAGPTGAEDDLNFVPASAGGGPYGIYIPFTPHDMARPSLLPVTSVFRIATHFGGVAAALLSAGEVSGEKTWWEWFFGKNHSQPNGAPSTGGGVGANNALTGDPIQDVNSKVNERGRMRAGSGLEIDNQRMKNSIKFGNFQVAIYEGIADALEEQIWKLATIGILGEAEAALIEVAAKKSWLFGKQVVQITIGKAVQQVSPDQIEKVKKVLRTAGVDDSIENVVDVIKGFSQKELKHAVEEVVEKFCFAPDTPVSTADGQRRIREVQVGDKVYAYDFATGQWVLAEVLKRHDNVYSGWIYTVLAGGSPIEVTANHPFWVIEGAELAARTVPRDLKAGENEGLSLAGRWVNSHELRPSDVLLGRSGEPIGIESIESRMEESFAVCSLTVRGQHTFTVGTDALLVHNGTAWCTTLEKFLDKPADLAKMAEKVGYPLHANHIVMRHPQAYFDADTRKALADSQEILRKAGIDLFDVSPADFAKRANADNIQNFAWAVNNYKGIHQKEYVMEIYRRLREAWEDTGKAGVEAALANMREQLHRGKDFWNK